jgi:hypothetical protein
MDDKLTTTDRKSSDYRIVCSEYPSGSSNTPQPPQRAEVTDHQGAQFGRAQIGRIWPTTVVAPRKGGAPQSKWTRKTRPWNAMLKTAVVASIEIEKPHRDETGLMPKLPYWTVGTHGVLRLQSRRRWQGTLREIPAAKLPERAAASSAPPSDVRSGGGDREALSIESMRRLRESRW